MKKLIKDLWLAVSLIILASAILLLSDFDQRKSNINSQTDDYPNIAIMQIASTPLLDSHVAGIIDRLKSADYLANDNTNLSLFNANGDYSTGTSISTELVNGNYDIVITSSTLALQVFSKANQNIKKTHIFGGVTNPYGAGVGISGPEPNQHPPYMAGIGTFQPVENSFRILHELNPNIKKVGVVWNPGEKCSEDCLSEARKICDELGIELIEAIATNTSEVAEAAKSLISKGVEAIWIGGDTVATASINMIVNIAEMANIPVFTNDPTDTEKNALFGLGANYFLVGQYTADIAIDILNGKSPASFRIENVIPEEFSLNYQVLERLGNNWKLTNNLKSKLESKNKSQEPQIFLDFADYKNNINSINPQIIVGADCFKNISLKNKKPARISIINLVENKSLEDAIRGVEEGLKWSGLKVNQDYIIKNYSAQGDISQLQQIIDAVKNESPDVIVTVTTPAMIATVNKVQDIPIVFTVSSDPFKLDVFKDKKQKNVCGVHDNPAIKELVEMALKHYPNIKRIGTVYDASQPNSLLSVEKLRKTCAEKGLEIIEATANTVVDLQTATEMLAHKGADAIIVSADNLTTTGFSIISKTAKKSNIPVFATETSLYEQGADGVIGDNFFEWGKQSGKLVAKIIAGAPVEILPISPTSIQEKFEPIKKRNWNRNKKLLELRIVHYSDTEFAERCHAGLVDGINNSGLKKGIDYNLLVYNAQGDMSTLSSIMSSIKSDKVDLLMVISTPTLQAALRQAGEDTKIVFTGVGDGVQAGAGKSETDHLPNVTGISTKSPFEGMAKLIKETVPNVKKVGTLFTPAEINSVLYHDWFKEELQALGIELVSVPVTTSADIPQSTAELCRQDIQVLCQIVDNFTRPGFALIARKAEENNVPVFVFDSDQMKEGGTVCLARDYYDAGLEAAEKAIRILNGENPKDIPFSNTKSEKLLYNPELAQKYNLQLSSEFINKASVFNPSSK